MLVFWTKVSVKRHFVSKLILMFLSLCLNGPMALGQTTSQNEISPTPSQEALFQRAFDSLAFVLLMAEQDKAFFGSLDQAERKMFDAITPIANEITTVNWMEDQKVHLFAEGGNDFYSYVITKNRQASVVTPTGTRVRLKFSSDRSIFDLKDGKGERSAVTSASFSDNIYVNLNKINSPGHPLTLGTAFSLIFHEFGRKLGKKMDEAATDSLAAKIQKYVDSITTITTVQNAKVHILKFRNAPFDPWMESFMFGIYQGVNIPPKLYPLIALDMQGTFILVENNNRFQDITNKVFAEDSKINRVAVTEDPHYSWRRLNWFLTDIIEIRPTSSGRFSIEINANQLQVVVPFLNPKSYEPIQYQLFERAYKSDPHNGVFLGSTFELDVRSDNLVIKKSYVSPLRFDSPQRKVELVEKRWEKDDLILRYKISGSKNYSYAENETFQLWPILIVEYEGKKIEIRASSFNDVSEQYEFQIPSLKRANAGLITLIGVEMVPDKLNLAKSGSDLRVRTFVPDLVKVPLEGQKVDSSPILKAIQVWDGQKWTSLTRQRNHQNTVAGQSIRFIFESTEKLRSLSLLQHFEHTLQNSVEAFPGTDKAQTSHGEEMKSARSAWITIDQKDLAQRLEAGKLYVSILIDKNVALSGKIVVPIDFPFPFPYEKGLPKYVAIETANSWVRGFRGLDVVRAVTQSLKVTEVQLRHVLNFEMNTQVPPNKSCKAWF